MSSYEHLRRPCVKVARDAANEVGRDKKFLVSHHAEPSLCVFFCFPNSELLAPRGIPTWWVMTFTPGRRAFLFVIRFSFLLLLPLNLSFQVRQELPSQLFKVLHCQRKSKERPEWVSGSGFSPQPELVRFFWVRDKKVTYWWASAGPESTSYHLSPHAEKTSGEPLFLLGDSSTWHDIIKCTYSPPSLFCCPPRLFYLFHRDDASWFAPKLIPAFTFH